MDLGEHLLKGLDRPERIYQLVVDGLGETFAPLRSVTELAREAEASRFPTGTVTFLVTDLVGSVTMLRALGAARYGAVLERYDEIVQDAVTAHDGQAFEMVGDSFIAVFGRARDALLAAIDASDVLAATEWPEASQARRPHRSAHRRGGALEVGLRRARPRSRALASATPRRRPGARVRTTTRGSSTASISRSVELRALPVRARSRTSTARRPARGNAAL